MTKEDMKQISDLMDEKFIASEGRVRAEIVASEARTGEKIDRVENNLSAEIKKNRISMTRHMQELNAKWVETNEKLDRMLARMDGMDKNMSAMRAEMDAVPKRFDAVETNLGRKFQNRRQLPGDIRKNCFSRWQKAKETFCTFIWAGRIKDPPETRIFRRILLSELLKYECTVALSTDRGFEELFKCLFQVGHILEPAVSYGECIANCGSPTSTVFKET